MAEREGKPVDIQRFDECTRSKHLGRLFDAEDRLAEFARSLSGEQSNLNRTMELDMIRESFQELTLDLLQVPKAEYLRYVRRRVTDEL